MLNEKRPILTRRSDQGIAIPTPQQPATEGAPQQPTVTITEAELGFLKHAAHGYIESIGATQNSSTQLKATVGFQPPSSRSRSSNS